MQGIIQDFQHAIRVLRKAPGFTASAIAVLALGIGANTAIFTVVNAVLLRPLPFPEPSRLVRLWHVPPERSFPGMKIFAVSPANYLDWKAQSHSFESMAAYNQRNANLTGRDHPESVITTYAEADFFDVVGVKPALGRTYTREEDQRGKGRVAVLSHQFWQTHFGGNASVLGRIMTLNGEPYTVVGVMPARF